MTTSTQFTIDPHSDDGFYVVVAGEVTVYEQYDDAIAEIQTKLASDTDGFLAEVAITADEDDDVAVTLEQVGWQQIIRDLAERGGDG